MDPKQRSVFYIHETGEKSILSKDPFSCGSLVKVDDTDNYHDVTG
jgi:hypothetical protein